MTKVTQKQFSKRTVRSPVWDRLAISGAVLLLVALVLMMFDGAVRNGQCSLLQFITFECNRWDAVFKPWE